MRNDRGGLTGACLCVLLLLAAGSSARAQPSPQLEALLGAPVTAGTDALLVRFARDPRVPLHWIEHLRHEEPLVRATAARALAATGVSAAVGRVRVALAAENHAIAAAEQSLALLLLGDGAHDAYALARLQQTDDQSLEQGLLIIASVRPASFAALTTTLLADAESPALPIAAALARLDAIDHGDVAHAYEEAVVAARRGRDVDALLELAITRDRRLQLETLLLALDDRPTTDRLMLIAEYVVLRHHRPARARNDDDFVPVLAAAWRADPASAADVDTVREIVRRWVEGSGGVTSSLVRKEAVSLLELFSLRATDVLTPDERLQLKERRFRGAQALRTDRAKPSWHPVALLSAVPHGLAGSLRAASGCRAEKRHDRIVEATYRPDGRPQAVSIPTGASRLPLPEGCVAMVEALTSLAYEPAGPPYPGTRVMFVRLDEAFTQCHDQPYPVRGTAEAAPPDTTSEVDKWERLTYPPKSVFRKDTGVVQVDAVVSPAGCVMAAWVRGPVTLELDAAALDGLSRAILSPARATGRRVPERIRMFAAFWNE